MIKREHYLSQIRPFYDSDLIKVITGIRRCGKSVIMDQIEEELREKGKKTLKLNFEKRSVSSEITSADELIEYVTKSLGEEKLYVFLDEIQTVSDWNIACRSLRLENISLFITGSNSKLLSGEFTKELSGRYVSFCIRPFVYKEAIEYCKELGREYSEGDYLLYGGFPKSLEFSDKDSAERYLNDLNDTIVMNDIMSRYKIRKTALFSRLIDYVLVSNSRIFSASSIQKYMTSQKESCSVNTIMKYISYLEEAYVIRQIPQYSGKAKRNLDYSAKLYDEDVSFNTIRQKSGRYDLTHNLENIVYNELVFMGYELSVFRYEDKEIDFLAQKGKKEYLIQVAYSIAEESTYEREFALFNKLDNSRMKVIITNDEVDFSTSCVRHIRFKDFLLMESL